MRYWWVNQNQTFEHEFNGGYLWSPKENQNGARNPFYETMREVAPGDLVLSFFKQHIVAVGIARSSCYENPKPDEFGEIGGNWNRIGWRVDVAYNKLENQIRPASNIGHLRPFLPDRYSPLQRNTGHGLQSVYLAEIPSPMMGALANLIGRQLIELMNANVQIAGDNSEEHCYADRRIEQWENYLERQIISQPAIRETEKEALVRSRRGQGLFRKRVIEFEKRCRITKVDNKEHLIASHCKPWRHSDNEERMDGENGLILTPSIDHLFDRGFISFEDNGQLLIAPRADKVSLERMGVETEEPVLVGSFSEGQKKYLDFHRNKVFLESKLSA